MPGKVKVKVISGKNLPVMDRSSDTTDAYVEIKLGGTTYKTDVCRRTLHPQWNTDWYRFEVDDSELQDEPLQIRLMDHDTYSANDAIGKVYLNLNPLLLPVAGHLIKYSCNGENASNHEISGWLPVYDTMHGIRGEVNVTVKVELFSDFNKFRQSSCGVQFFYSPCVPHGYSTKIIHGFVEELIVDDDPEYQWIDKIRTPRASNEARQTLFFKLSGELQRKIGVKALNLGGNAVIGYKQCFDFEGESGIVARGIGTAVTLVKCANLQTTIIDPLKEENVENYLKFVGGQKGFCLTSAQSVSKLLISHIPTYHTSLTNVSSFRSPKHEQFGKRMYSSMDASALSTPHSVSSGNLLQDHNVSLKELLNQEDKRGVSTHVFSRKIQKLKYSQKSLSKKMTALKAKLGDSIGEVDEESSSPLEISSKRKLFKRATSDSSVMAKLLARSVIQAQNSLSCILEHQTQMTAKDSDTLEKLEPLVNLLNKSQSEISGNNDEYFDDDDDDRQTYSSSESTTSSTSDSEYDYTDYKQSNFEVDTISNIITNVEKLQKALCKEPLKKQHSLPILPISMPSIPSNLEHISSEFKNNPIATNNDIIVPTMEPKFNFDSNITEAIKSETQPEQNIDPKVIPDEISNIIGPVEINNVNIQSKGLVKTAMQTMLLEKVNIMGTYTPPVSPNSESAGISEYQNINRKSSFPFSNTSSISKSHSTASFCNYDGKCDTVLGMPFVSMSKLKAEYFKELQSQPELSKYYAKNRQTCFSDSQLHQSDVDSLNKSLRQSKKRKLKFLHLKTGNEGNNKNIISRMFHKHTAEKNIKDEQTQTSLETVYNSTPIVPSCSTNVVINIEANTTTSGNIEISPDNFSTTKLACITPNRQNLSPAESGTLTAQEDQRSESTTKFPQSPAKINALSHRRSSDSDISITPKGNSLTGSDRSVGNTANYMMRYSHHLRPHMNQEHFDMLEYPFLTMTKIPAKLIVHIGGSVSARSVKLLERITNVDEPESRDTWWSEIRMEIRSHARSLNCNAVLGYSELTSICDDVCVLSACGTAAVILLPNYDENEENSPNILHFKPRSSYQNKEIVNTSLEKSVENNDRNMNGTNIKGSYESPDHVPTRISCRIGHLPYDEKTVPVKAKITKCSLCSKGRVPEVLIATIEPPDDLPNIGKGCFIESYVCRSLKDVRGEYIAKEISDGLPFLEYELHRLLVNKLKIKGMNAVFSLKIRISVGERMVLGVATGTAMYLSSLPQPATPTLVSDRMSDEKKLQTLQDILNETIRRNREIYQIKDDNQSSNKLVSDDESEEEPVSLDISAGNKDCCVLEVDDPEDAEVLNLLMEERIPEGFHVVNSELVPGLDDLEIVKNLQMFTQIYRAKFHPPFNLHKHFLRLLQSVYFKLRRMVPCALCDLQFRVDIPEPDEIQLCIIGMALGLGKNEKTVTQALGQKRNDEDLIFKLEEDTSPENGHLTKINQIGLKYKQKSPSKYRGSIKQRHIPYKERHGVDITPLSYVPGGKIEQYLGNLNFFFIRETNSIREEGGLSGFIHSFVTEVLAIVRAHVTALGGNAMVAFFLTECILNHNLHKNQGQCLINVGGDVVSVSYFKEEPC